MDVVWRELAATPSVVTDTPSVVPSAAAPNGNGGGMMAGIGELVSICFLFMLRWSIYIPYATYYVSCIIIPSYIHPPTSLLLYLSTSTTHLINPSPLHTAPTSSLHPALMSRRPPAPPHSALPHPALHSTSRGTSSSPGNAEAQLFGSQGKNLTHLLPVVNEKEGMKQYFTLILPSVYEGKV